MSEQTNPTPGAQGEWGPWEYDHYSDGNAQDIVRRRKLPDGTEIADYFGLSYLNDLEAKFRQLTAERDQGLNDLMDLNRQLEAARSNSHDSAHRVEAKEQELSNLRTERDDWRRLAVEHGAEVQADNEYLLKRHEPQMKENAELMKIVGRFSDQVARLRAALEQILLPVGQGEGHRVYSEAHIARAALEEES